VPITFSNDLVDRRLCHAQRLGRRLQRVSREHAEAIQWAPSNAHEQHHQGSRQAVISADLL
jgi:hypothetical protein